MFETRIIASAPEVLTIPREGGALSGTLYRPAGRPRAAVLLAGATGVPAGYYRAFATWLAESRDLAVLTFDYRDFGASGDPRRGPSQATMRDWALVDPAAALQALAARFPGLPLWWIGHSLGGLWLHHLPGAERLARVITLGSGHAHLDDHPPRYRWKARLFWSRPLVAIARVRGFLPGRLLRMGPDLPLGVYRDWREWCTTRGWVAHGPDDAGFPPDPDRIAAPFRLIAVADDDLVPPAAVWRLMGLHRAAYFQQMTLRPADFGLPRIGHLAAFRPENRALWPKIVD